MKPRMTVTGYVHYRLRDRQPVTVPIRFTRELEKAEQLFQRYGLEAKGDWAPLQVSWPEWESKPAQIVISNQAPEWSEVPTPEQRADAAAKILEVGVKIGTQVVPFAWVRPGETSFTLEPAPGAEYYVRCKSNGCKYNVYSVPT